MVTLSVYANTHLSPPMSCRMSLNISSLCSSGSRVPVHTRGGWLGKPSTWCWRFWDMTVLSDHWTDVVALCNNPALNTGLKQAALRTVTKYRWLTLSKTLDCSKLIRAPPVTGLFSHFYTMMHLLGMAYVYVSHTTSLTTSTNLVADTLAKSWNSAFSRVVGLKLSYQSPCVWAFS